jgi:hypothetical protein
LICDEYYHVGLPVRFGPFAAMTAIKRKHVSVVCLSVLLCPLSVNMRAAINQMFTVISPLTSRFTYSALLKRVLWKLNLNYDLIT